MEPYCVIKIKLLTKNIVLTINKKKQSIQTNKNCKLKHKMNLKNKKKIISL